MPSARELCVRRSVRFARRTSIRSLSKTSTSGWKINGSSKAKSTIALMSDDGPVYLVVGSDSLIGGALLRRLRDAGQHAVGTTRRRTQVEHAVYLDLVEGPDKWQPPLPVTVAIVCTGVTRLQAC